MSEIREHKHNVSWWVQLIIAVLSAIGGAVTGATCF